MVTGDHPDTARAIACGGPSGLVGNTKKMGETMRGTAVYHGEP